MLVFVCGFPSGGTDLVKTVLNAHPDIYLNGEMPLLWHIAQYGYDHTTKFEHIAEIQAFQRVLRRLNTWNNIENLDHDFAPELAGRQLTIFDILKTCFSARPRLVWGNKTPQNTENIDALSALFPNARYVVVTRDVRDICLSWQRKWGKDVLYCAAKWADRMASGWHSTSALPSERYLYLKFEDLLSDTESSCRLMCGFLGIAFSPRMLEHHKYTERVIDGKLNYGLPIIPDNMGKWRHELPRKTVQRVEEIAIQTMDLLGYDTEYATVHRPLSPSERLRGQCSDLAALVTVGNRASKNNSLWDRLLFVGLELRKRLLRWR